MRVNIHLVEHHEDAIVLPQSFQAYRISDLFFGQKTRSCRIYYHSHHPHHMYVSTTLSEKLGIRDGMEMNLLLVHRRLYIGPVVGILSAGFTKSPLRPLGKRSMMFSKYIESSKKAGSFSYVFGAHQIDWENEWIEGYTYTNKGWEKIKAPFPNVIYNRLPNRKVETLDTFQSLMKSFQQKWHIPLFNERFLSKTDVTDFLVNTPCEAYIPATIPNPTIKQVEDMIHEYFSVFLKPINGSLGLGVYKLSYTPQEKKYYARYIDEKNQKRLTKYPSIQAFFTETFQNRQLSRYIVQQAIPLLHHQQLPIDFRVHTNKDEHGKWKLSAMAGKVAGKGSVTTHVKTGGTILTIPEIETLLQPSFSIRERLHQAALSISEQIEERIDGDIGEIGFDFGIDRDGEVWLFEANSKPGRSIFHHDELNREDHLTRELIFFYAQFLMKQSIHEKAGTL